MSELKAVHAFDVYEAYTKTGDDDAAQVYPKVEADAVIAKLKMKLIEQATLRAWAELQLHHNKYKRCLAMVKFCNYWANYWECCQPSDCGMFIARAKFFRKWHKRWLAIAEKFKPNN